MLSPIASSHCAMPPPRIRHSRHVRPRGHHCSYLKACHIGVARTVLCSPSERADTGAGAKAQHRKFGPATSVLFWAGRELGSFSRAAAALSIGQPIVSRFIRRLEDELQIQLFHRHGRGVQLTEAGERLLERSRAILRNLSQARTEITALGGVPVGSVSVAMPPLFGHMLAVDLLETA